MTAASGPGAPDVASHAAEPLPGTSYTVGGPYVNQPLNPLNELAYPAQALCRCREWLRRESLDRPWKHAGETLT